jgi:hypothetical protein
MVWLVRWNPLLNAAKAALLFFAMNAVWEATQIPLYTLWQQGSWGEIILALVHCTAGDLLIGINVAAATAAALFLLTKSPPKLTTVNFLGLFLVMGIGYTVFSEWLNVEVRGTWAYTEQMPVLPLLGTGLTPLLQWLIVPTLAWALMARQRKN